MAQLNRRKPAYDNTTHEGAPARRINTEQELRRSVLSCLLWENQFYEGGVEIGDRIAALVHTCDADVVADLAIEARNEFRMRHVPLLLTRELARHKDRSRTADTLFRVIQRPDELTEFLAIYWKDGREPLSAQVKKGLARAFTKFSSYQLAKYNRDGQVKLRDVLFLSHAKPKDEAQAEVWKKLVDGTLEAPDTWEVNLSAGADKKETFTRLIKEGKLGYMALMRNLRKMTEVGVDRDLINGALLEGAGRSKALPFRYIAAAKAAPQFEPALDKAMLAALAELPRLPGKTKLLVDVSGSMSWNSSGKSDLTMMDRGAALAALVAGISDDFEVYTFSTAVKHVPPRQGMALVDAVIGSQPHGGTRLGAAVSEMNKTPYDRLIVFTDEQSSDFVPGPKSKGYMVNVASYQRGVGYGAWTHIDGFSEAVITFIQELEAL